MKLSKLTVNTDLEDNGQWITWTEYPSVSGKFRSIHYPPFQKALSGMNQRLSREYGGKSVPSEVLTRGYSKLVCQMLWLDVAGLTGDDDEPIVLTDQLREAVATQREYRPLMDFVAWAVARVGQIEQDEYRADAGNSETTPAGSEAGVVT